MIISPRKVIESINFLLSPLNLYLDTLTVKNLEQKRLVELDKKGHFESTIFTTPDSFNSEYYLEILKGVESYKKDLDRFTDSTLNDSGYSYKNGFFSSPDAEVLYTMIRDFKPEKIIEIGCGNSTKITRQAILDGKLSSKLISIDPFPRLDIAGLTDKSYIQPIESLCEENMELFTSLKAGDVLFIDSSHSLKTGNDVAFIYTKVIPELKPGVLIHIHDIFLPYDYPKSWILDQKRDWNEQYLVYLMLSMSNLFEVLWAGYFLQKTTSDFPQYFPNLQQGSNAQSLWIRKS